MALLAGACQSRSPSSPSAAADSASAREVAPALLPLGPPLDRVDVEISGLTWYGDTLVVLPQFPSRMTDVNGRGRLYGISRAALKRAVADSARPLLEPTPIPIAADGLGDHTTVYEGCEGLLFIGKHVYVVVEGAREEAGMEGILYRGSVAPGLRSIRLQTSSAQLLPMQAALPNMSYEALTARGDTILALFEANGKQVNPSAAAYRYEPDLQPADAVSFPPLEYRLTDATNMDSQGRFWVINYFYPEEQNLLDPGRDSVAVRFGEGTTHRASDVVERLVEYRYTPSGIHRTETPPIWLKLEEGTPRNWEGLARFGDGFLLATDKYPTTILAHVPDPPGSSP